MAPVAQKRVARRPAEAIVRVGISGWRYPPWRGRFYPRELRQDDELSFAASAMPTIEINGTFYSLQRPECFVRWYEETPPDFVFALKGSRYVTHMLKLRNVDAALANFFASGPLVLREKLGPILWQLPPVLSYDEERLARFFASLPRTSGEAGRLARRHDHRVDGRSYLKIDRDRPLRHALEVRHPSYATPRLAPFLRDHDVALVVADTARTWPYFEEVTADFVYIRLHGDAELYSSGYGPAALRSWADKIRGWAARGLDIYCYFDNDKKAYAPWDALELIASIEGER